MPEARIPFGNLQSSGIEELSGGMPVCMNIVADSAGTVRRRPGLTSYLSSINVNGVSALYETVNGDVYAVAGTVPTRDIYFVTSGGAADISGHPQGDLAGTARPVIAETEALLVIAGGAEPEKIVLSTKTTSRLGGSPPQGTSIVANHSRLLTNDISSLSQVSYSAPAVGGDYSGSEDWSTPLLAGTFTGEARPDPVVALGENTAEVFLFGATTVQVFAPSSDPQNPFQPTVTRELGCSAPYSVIKTDESFAWLDHLRRFVISDGRSQKILSEPIQKTLHDMTTVSDCIGYRVVQGWLDMLVWTFPTDGRTFCFQQGAQWAEWSGWDGETWTDFPVTAATKLKALGKTLVGTSSGALATLDFEAQTDLGSPINSYCITGFQSHDTDKWKSCDRVRFSLRRGQASSGEPYLLLSWRDGLSPWEDPIPVSLGAAGDYDPVVELWGMGTYRRRQWKLEFTNAEDLVLVAATEEFTVLEN